MDFEVDGVCVWVAFIRLRARGTGWEKGIDRACEVVLIIQAGEK